MARDAGFLIYGTDINSPPKINAFYKNSDVF
jgi:hypothetical protein